MSKSLKRVRAAMQAAGLPDTIVETHLSRTAQDAADAVGCSVGQIVKSIILKGVNSGQLFLFLTSGANQVNLKQAAKCAGETLERADADEVRRKTGFAIGGVSPFGHLSPIRCFLDPSLLDYPEIWAAAGTPHHVFSMSPDALCRAIDPEVVPFC